VDCEGETCDPIRCTGVKASPPLAPPPPPWSVEAADAATRTHHKNKPGAAAARTQRGGGGAPPVHLGHVPSFGAARSPASSGTAFGPVPGAVNGLDHVGWAVDNDDDASPEVWWTRAHAVPARLCIRALSHLWRVLCHLHSDSAATVHSSHCGVCSLCVMQVVDGAVRVTGDSRVYLVQDHRAPSWEHHQ
jgi:hypothetical protein